MCSQTGISDVIIIIIIVKVSKKWYIGEMRGWQNNYFLLGQLKCSLGMSSPDDTILFD